jgi:hypothetical protein
LTNSTFTRDGTLECIHHALYGECRERAEREASPTAAIIDSQSVKSAEKGGFASAGSSSGPSLLGRCRRLAKDWDVSTVRRSLS